MSATAESDYQTRRRFLTSLGVGTAGAIATVATVRHWRQPRITAQPPIESFTRNNTFSVNRPLTEEDRVLRFNNFYEFAADKRSVVRYSRGFRLDPYTLVVDGLVKRPLALGLEDLQAMQLEERVYRFRCVEAWAMTVPWVGIPLASILARVEPTARAKYVAFESFFDVSQAPRQADHQYPWPYREGLQIEEAMNPLAFIALGMYGRLLQPQNGAPVRIVLPWKYGFKGPKSVVKITLTATRPPSFWHALQPLEYGFTANVDPAVPHPRWSQSHEIEIGAWGRRRPTLKFNGYGEWVAHLYPRR
ncbi:MAG: protein-methionine-sulfoxide reductase catalytic subunit MsrP [Planctomycetota bacterium]|nr:protein-methionine-sulfoxide reductase catalytic subunit MsrP [Planctomycetota bacterium]